LSRSRSSLELAAERAVTAVAPVLVDVLAEEIRQTGRESLRTAEARGALMQLARALESATPR
jgi:hypothetical protein